VQQGILGQTQEQKKVISGKTGEIKLRRCFVSMLWTSAMDAWAIVTWDINVEQAEEIWKPSASAPSSSIKLKLFLFSIFFKIISKDCSNLDSWWIWCPSKQESKQGLPQWGRLDPEPPSHSSLCEGHSLITGDDIHRESDEHDARVWMPVPHRLKIHVPSPNPQCDGT
jgi:hypothetical protein